MNGPFKMKGFSGFGNSPLNNNKSKTRRFFEKVGEGASFIVTKSLALPKFAKGIYRKVKAKKDLTLVTNSYGI